MAAWGNAANSRVEPRLAGAAGLAERKITLREPHRRCAPLTKAPADIVLGLLALGLHEHVRFPLGSTRRVVMVDEAERYAGVIVTALADAEPDGGDRPVSVLAVNPDAALTPDQSIKEVMRAFDNTEADELAVVDVERRVIGLVSKAHATRRYAEELEKVRRDLTGES